MNNQLVAITSYYNPLSYKRRLVNYHLFRNNLNVPLVTVELGNNGRYELTQADADILVQIPSGSVLWQKERLLNVALQHVPDDAEAVAWIDCDVIFEQEDWPSRALALLKEKPLIQLFDRGINLEKDVLPATGIKPEGKRIPSFASLDLARNRTRKNMGSNRNKDTNDPLYRTGLAWAARKSLLDDHGFYDFCIIGGGDHAGSNAAAGWISETVDFFNMNPKRSEHYLNWANRFYNQVNNNIDSISGEVYHLWHGQNADLHYVLRQKNLSQFDFDPNIDIRINPHGAWEWATDKPEMHAFVENYFRQRNEDGTDDIPNPSSI